MSKFQGPSCSIDEIINGMLARIKTLENRLDEMEQNFQGHVLNDKIHIKHKSYRAPSRNSRTSPPPPPPRGDDHGFIIYRPIPTKRQTSAPARMQTPVNVDGPVPEPPPLPKKNGKLRL